jgi:hypothetical protein
MADTELKAVTDPDLVKQLSQLWKESQGLTEQPKLEDVQQQFKQTGQLPGAREYQTPVYPGSPLRQLAGTALQVGSAFIPPLMEAGIFPRITQGLQAMRGAGQMGSMASRAIPMAAEAATATAGSKLSGGGPMEMGLSAALPMANRIFGAPSVKGLLGRPLAESMLPDMTRDAVASNIEKQFGPSVFPRTLWEQNVRPYNDMFLTTPKTVESLKKLVFPGEINLTSGRLTRDVQRILAKYTPSSAANRPQLILPRMGPGKYGMPEMPSDAITLGNMYDDMRKLDMYAGMAQKEGLGYYAGKLRDVKDSMLDDMVKAVPALKDARAATWKQGNVQRLWDIMGTGRPIDEWRSAAKESWVNKAFTKSEQEDITRTMEQMARLGGGEHWVGRILGHAAIGGGVGWATGHPATGAMIGGAAGVLMPHVMGQAMANPGGRAFLRGLMSKYPMGMTASAANALMQWYMASMQTGGLGFELPTR